MIVDTRDFCRIWTHFHWKLRIYPISRRFFTRIFNCSRFVCIKMKSSNHFRSLFCIKKPYVKPISLINLHQVEYLPSPDFPCNRFVAHIKRHYFNYSNFIVAKMTTVQSHLLLIFSRHFCDLIHIEKYIRFSGIHRICKWFFSALNFQIHRHICVNTKKSRLFQWFRNNNYDIRGIRWNI